MEVTITGRVQAVMFRDFTKRKAQKLGLVGFVKNNEDGSVFVVSEGKKEQLEKLLSYLSRGPLLARVENVNVVWKEPEGCFSDFQIRF